MKTVFVTTLVAFAAVSGSAMASDFSQINGFSLEARLFNDFANTNLTINGVNYPAPVTAAIPNPGSLNFTESFAQGAAGNFANKHVAWLSDNGGATRATTNASQPLSLDFDIFMSAVSGSPRKEAGVQINQPRPSLGFTDEGQILIASDNGEVAVFGAALPFTGFGAGTYTLGTTAHVSFQYVPAGVVDPTLGAYRLVFSDAVTGVHDSGFKVWGVESDGIAGLTNAVLGLKDQNQRNPFVADGVTVIYSGINVTPAPTSAALLGLAGLAMGRRRR